MRSSVERLYPTANDLPKDVRSKIVKLLNQQLADALDLDANTKQAHWNVKGTVFVALHKLFDEVHDSVEDYADLLAERVVQLGGMAEGAVRTTAKCSTLTPYPADISSAGAHSSAMAKSLAEFGKSMRKSIDTASDLGDQASADVCTEISRGVDKWLWFVEAHGQTQNGTSTAAGATNGATP